jgi:crotonobetainyl-CoA:carnitine CoA-transferase CaiB-like acyl-CoA transferase
VWVAVTVADDATWAALAALLGGDALDARYATLAGRLAHHDALDELIGRWTAQRSPADAAARLQHAGVAAYEVLDNVGVLNDPQVRDRGTFQWVPSARFPDGDVFTGFPIDLPDVPGRWHRSGPSLGEDTVEVLTTRGGLSTGDVDAMVAAGDAYTLAAPDVTLRRPYVDYVEIIGVRGTVR